MSEALNLDLLKAGPLKEVKIKFLGRDFKVSCHAHEIASLEEAALFLEDKMRAVAGTEDKLINVDRLAIVVALNLASEMVAQNKSFSDVEKRLQVLEDKMVQALQRE